MSAPVSKTAVQHAHVNGLSLAYRFDGPAQAPVLMLANSLAADTGMWDDNIAAMAQNYRVLRYDMRGHGSSAAPAGEYTAKGLADDAIHLLDHLGISQLHFVGLSLGGIVGQQLGARYGARLLSLTLCDTMSAQAAPALWTERIATVRALGMQSVLQGTIERWFTPAFAQSRAARLAEVKTMILATHVDGYTGCAAAVRDLQQTSMLAQISVPTLVLTGDQDLAAPPAVARQMVDAIPGARLHVVKDAAHLSNLEQPAAFNAAVLGFVGQVSTDSR